MKRTFFIPLIGTPVYAIRQMGIDIPFTVQFLQGAYKKNDKNWRLNQEATCPVVLKDRLTPRQIDQIKKMDIIFGIPPCRFLSMLNVRHDNYAQGDSQNCMIDIAKQAVKYNPKIFCFQNAPRFSSAKRALQWAIPQLISIMKPRGYRFMIYKTSTLNHGLPQKRQRTFFLAYKSPHIPIGVYKHKNDPVTVNDLISDLRNQNSQSAYSSDARNDLQKWFRKDNNVVTSMQTIQDWFYWKQLMKYCRDPNRSLMWQIMYKGDQYGYKWPQMLRQVKDQRDHRKLKKIFQFAQMKMAKGLGYWDSSPMLRSGSHINAVISKNAYRLVHPNKTRLLTLRQLRRFMGIPDRFKFHQKNRSAALHYATQNVPSFTYANVRWQAKKMAQFAPGPNSLTACSALPTQKDLVFVDNLSDDDFDLYFDYNSQQIKQRTKGLGKDRKPFFKTDNYEKSFIKKINS